MMSTWLKSSYYIGVLLATFTASFAAPTDSNYSFGGSPLGTWVQDAHSLPSFGVNLSFLAHVAPTIYSDLHMVGNDRYFAFVAADGGVTLRQDEGGPKLLNDFSPLSYQYAGGVGWLFAEDSIICDTNVTPGVGLFTQSMVFGVAYLKKTCAEPGGLRVEHTLWAPFGDVSALVSTVSITNEGTGEPKVVTWLEQWAAGSPVLLAGGLKRPTTWNASFEELPGGVGVLSRKLNPSGDPTVPVLADDPSPRAAFLLSLDAAVGSSPSPSFGVDGSTLFGNAGPRAPNLAALNNATVLPEAGWREGVLALASPKISLAAGQTRTVSNLYGYLPRDTDTVGNVVNRVLAFGMPGTAAFNSSAAAWLGNLSVVLDLPSVGAWVARETAWHSYTLRALLSYDSYRERFNLNQNGEYQNTYLRPGGKPPEIDGFNGASRDSLAHIIPLIYGPPAGLAVVKDTIKFWLQTQLDSGMIAWGQAGYGVDWRGWTSNSPWLGHVCSDLPYWPLLAAAEYVLATRDIAFLSELVSRNGTNGGTLPAEPVLTLLLRAFDALFDSESGNGVGLGEHGLLRILGADHNDGFYGATGQAYFSHLGLIINATGESVMSSATAAFVLCRYAAHHPNEIVHNAYSS